MSLKYNRIIITVAMFASLLLCPSLVRDMGEAYGSRGGGLTGGGGGGFSGPGGSQGGGANVPNNPTSPIADGETGGTSGPLGPHGPYGPGPTGPHESGNTDDNTNVNNKNKLNAARNPEGPVVINPQSSSPSSEPSTQTDVTIEAPPATSTTEEEQAEQDQEQEQQQQQTSNDDGDSAGTENQNQVPVANAGPSLTAKPSSNVALDGTKSYDPNGDSLQFLWLQLAGGPTVPLQNSKTSTPSFTAPFVTNTTVLAFQLIVSDGQTDSTPTYTHITVQP
jgi:hypothetical protein